MLVSSFDSSIRKVSPMQLNELILGSVFLALRLVFDSHPDLSKLKNAHGSVFGNGYI